MVALSSIFSMIGVGNSTAHANNPLPFSPKKEICSNYLTPNRQSIFLKVRFYYIK
jgi:hypothetical protein